MVEPITITIGGILTAIGWAVLTALNTAISIVEKFGYPPFALFLIALFYYDLQSNWIGSAISLVTDWFFHIKITSLFLFMFIIFTLIAWLFWKVRQFHQSGAFSR